MHCCCCFPYFHLYFLHSPFVLFLLRQINCLGRCCCVRQHGSSFWVRQHFKFWPAKKALAIFYVERSTFYESVGPPSRCDSGAPFCRLHRWRDSRIAPFFVARHFILLYRIRNLFSFGFSRLFFNFYLVSLEQVGPIPFWGWPDEKWRLAVFLCVDAVLWGVSLLFFLHLSINKWIKIEIEYVMLIRLSCAAADFRFHSNCCEWIEFEMLHHWTTRPAKSINPMRNISTATHWMLKLNSEHKSVKLNSYIVVFGIHFELFNSPGNLCQLICQHTTHGKQNPMQFE